MCYATTSMVKSIQMDRVNICFAHGDLLPALLFSLPVRMCASEKERNKKFIKRDRNMSGTAQTGEVFLEAQS